MLLSHLLEGIETSSVYEDREINGIKDDTRENLSDCLFVCIRGSKIDGHIFAKAALEKGAGAILCEEDLGLKKQILVKDTKEAYALACKNWYHDPARDMLLTAVTGTNGKTSVATIIKRLLEQNTISTGLLSTIQAEFAGEEFPLARTTPDAKELQSLLCRMKEKGIRAVSMEASSHALDQKRLFGLHFRVAVFTNLTQDHLDYHKNMEEYFKAKQKLFDMADMGVINLDDNYGKRLISELKIPFVTYSVKDSSADYFAEDIDYQDSGMEFTLCKEEDKRRVSFGIPGLYSVANALAAAAACEALGLSLDQIVQGLRKVGTIKGRNEIIPSNFGFQIICDYAHTPDGLENILKSTKDYAKGRIILVFGCGGDRDKTKRPLMGAVAARYADFLVVTSDNPRTENPGAIIGDILKGIPFDTPHIALIERREAIRYAISRAKKGDIIILAGKGHEEYQILGEKQLYFDEKRLVKGILQSMQE